MKCEKCGCAHADGITECTVREVALPAFVGDGTRLGELLHALDGATTDALAALRAEFPEYCPCCDREWHIHASDCELRALQDASDRMESWVDDQR